MSYTKLFQTIITSTIWTEDANTCKVWVTMLAIANKHGEVQASIPGLAQVAGLPLDIVETAINKFLAPDKYSRTPDDEGRRIEKIEGGWVLLNHAKYREMASREEEVASNAKRQAAFRERQARNGIVTEVTDSNGIVTERNAVSQDVTKSSHIADTDTDTELSREREKGAAKSPTRRPNLDQAKSAASTIGITEDKAAEWWNAREASEWMKGMAGGGTAPVGTNWQADLTTYAKRGGYGSGMGNSKPDHRAAKREGEFKELIQIKHL
jgi:hypothetical protein